MDLLASLNIEDLPEQQTRLVHLMEEHPDFKLQLGFDACCTCAAQLDKGTTVTCLACKRVNYCSEACRQRDAEAISSAIINNDDAGDENDGAMGHSSIICTLLQCTQYDENMEENKDDGMPESRRIAAQDRIRSELESYPATLSNVLLEGPCYQECLSSKGSSTKVLTIHVVGASDDAELWDSNNKQDDKFEKVCAAYAEALSELSSSFGLSKIELFFIGPECPPTDLEMVKSMKSVDQNNAGDLRIQTVKGVYNADLLEARSTKPDIVVFFNPGFTVPEYSWNESLACIPKGTPFLSTTNTELEGIADCQYLLDQDKIETIPVGLADIFGLHSGQDEDDERESSITSFFSVNPFSGNRVRQSGTMANDLFVKNRWMLGGILDVFDQSKALADTPSKRIRTEGTTNTKSGNPALI